MSLEELQGVAVMQSAPSNRFILCKPGKRRIHDEQHKTGTDWDTARFLLVIYNNRGLHNDG